MRFIPSFAVAVSRVVPRRTSFHRVRGWITLFAALLLVAIHCATPTLAADDWRGATFQLLKTGNGGDCSVSEVPCIDSPSPAAVISQAQQWTQELFDKFIEDSNNARDEMGWYFNGYHEPLSPASCYGWEPFVTYGITCQATYQVTNRHTGAVSSPQTFGAAWRPSHRLNNANSEDGCGPMVGNPCNVATGAKVHSETDFQGSSGQLGLRRHYDSLSARASSLGGKWAHDYDRRVFVDTANPYEARLHRPGVGNGTLTFFQYNNVWYSYFGVDDTLTGSPTSGWTLTLSKGGSEHYDTSGRITHEVSASGQTTTYAYDTSGRLATVTSPYGQTLTFNYSGDLLTSARDGVGNVVQYIYDAAGNLTSVQDAEGRVRHYHYEDSNFPQHLTGISDTVNSQLVRYAIYAYDTAGKAILSEHAGGQGRITLSYASNNTTVTDAAGNTRTYYFSNNHGARRLTQYREGAVVVKYFSYNSRNNLSSASEPGDYRTYTYNTVDQRTSQNEANGMRVTTYQYLSPSHNLPTIIETPSVYSGQKKRTTIAYNTALLPTTITQSGYTPTGQAVSRTVAMSYDSAGRVVSIDGPRTDVNDVTTLAYYNCATGGACGQLASITNALGHVTTFDSYDAHGRLLQMTDPNGSRTSYQYDGKGRVRFVTQTPASGSARTSEYRYDFAGNVTFAAFPDGRTLSYTYDAAEQLSRVTDNVGNYVQYSYDTRGNRSREATHDPDGTLARYVESSFNYRNDVATLNAGGSLTQYTRDAGGRITRETDPKGTGHVNYTFDSLRRLTGANRSGPANASYQYNIHDHVTRVQNHYVYTHYTYDDLGNLLKEDSPDRGITTYSYDSAGNLASQTDARAVTVNYAYDALNRVTSVDYPGTAEDIAYTYDSGEYCARGIGRLCRVQDESGSTEYAYDGLGNVLAQRHTEMGIAYTTGYAYDAADRVASMTYPDGRIANYARDALGRVREVSVTLNNAQSALVGARTYRSDGLLTAQAYGNGVNETREYDLQGRLTTQFVGSVDTRVYGYDANGNLTSLQSLPQVGSYSYDTVNRLTQDRITSSPASTVSFSYLGSGNRTSDGAYYTYANPYANNRLVQVGSSALTLDAAGNTLTYGSARYSYNGAGHLAQVFSGSVLAGSYVYNHQRQRTRKIVGAQATVYHYDLAGNLILETGAEGASTRAYVWAEGAPLAQIDRSGTQETLLYLHSDHEGTPRLATDATGVKVWGWEGRAFGNTAPMGTAVVNLRFPGQYYDGESGLFYNWNRYYDPKIGRYITSDPIGINGGLNTYGYANQNPLRWTDPTGLLGKHGVPPGWPSGPGSGNYGPFGSVCGSGPSATLIPDGPWKEACENHDKCYDRCGVSRFLCDINFLFDSGGNIGYFLMIRRFGGGPFEEAQNNACCGGNE